MPTIKFVVTSFINEPKVKGWPLPFTVVDPIVGAEVADKISAPVPVQWNTERVRQLVGLWVSNASISDIATALGVSRSAIVGKIKSLRAEPV